MDLIRRALPNLARGFCMGAVDVVPGVSGGTIALILGIYERLIASIRAASAAAGFALRLDRRRAGERLREVDWWLIIPLLAGILIAIITLARLIEHFLDEEPEALSGLFLGLVVASIVVAWRLIRRPLPVHALVIVAFAVGTFFLLGLRNSAVSDPGALALVGAGALAICAMILPGISGSFILLMIGMYDAVIAAVNDRDIARLAAFALGAAIGLALFSSILHWLLRRFHDLVLAALIGLMIGSLRVLWPWPEGIDSAEVAAPPSGEWVVPALLALVGVVAVLLLAWIGGRRGATPRSGPAPTAGD